jgi:hypothetical protein
MPSGEATRNRGLISRLTFCERGGDIYTDNDGFISTVALWADKASKGRSA